MPFASSISRQIILLGEFQIKLSIAPKQNPKPVITAALITIFSPSDLEVENQLSDIFAVKHS